MSRPRRPVKTSGLPAPPADSPPAPIPSPAPAASAPPVASPGTPAAAGRETGAPGERRSFLTAFIGREEYALPLGRVHEVMPHEGLTRVPTAPDFVAGLVSLHGAAVPVIDLGLRFGAPPERLAGRSIAVVGIQVRERPTLVGIAIDRLGRVLHVAAERIVPPPQLDSLIAVEFLTGVFERESSFVLCLDVDRLLGADEAAQVAELSERQGARAAAEPKAERIPFLCVRLAGERCALGLTRLHEILPCGEVAPIPGAPPYVLGATNVRGSIVPVIDVARRYGLGETRRDASSCLLLVEVAEEGAEAPVGVLVESIERLAHVPAGEVNTTPPFGARFPVELVLGMAPIGGEFVPILDTEPALADGSFSVEWSAPAPGPARR